MKIRTKAEIIGRFHIKEPISINVKDVTITLSTQNDKNYVDATKKVTDYLDTHKISYLTGITWTTDAMFRETKALVEQRKAEGAIIVEMEQAGCIAIAQYRKFDYAAIIYGGDDVSQDEWDTRSWDKRKGIRYNLVMLCRELVKEI